VCFRWRERPGPKPYENHRKEKAALGGGVADLRNVEVTVILEMLFVKCKLKFSSRKTLKDTSLENRKLYLKLKTQHTCLCVWLCK